MARTRLADCSSLGAGQWDWLVTNFALLLLLKALRQGSLGRPSEATGSLEEASQNLATLDAMLPLLVASLKARHSALVSTALRCLGLMLQLPLPGDPSSRIQGSGFRLIGPPIQEQQGAFPFGRLPKGALTCSAPAA